MSGLAAFYEARDKAQEAHHESYMAHLHYWRVPDEGTAAVAADFNPPKVIPKPTRWEFTPEAMYRLIRSAAPEDMWGTLTPRMWEDGEEKPATLFGLPIQIVRDVPDPGWRIVASAK